MSAFLSPDYISDSYSAVYLPALPLLNLSQDEQNMIARLTNRAYRRRAQMLLWDAYYRGEQVIHSLGISMPPELEGIRVITGWARTAVDPFVERLHLDSYRLSDNTIADKRLTEFRIQNNMESEETLAFNEALVMGRSYFTFSRDETAPADSLPDVCVETPLNLSIEWDVRGRFIKAALQSYWQDDRRHAALYLPDQTIFLAQDDTAQWVITYRDIHNFGFVPIVRMANRPRASNRDGSSEITAELMSIIDAACRTMLNLTVAGEFYSVPQKLILGATEEDFIASDGTQKTAWDTYMGRVLALQRDGEGALPEVHQFQVYDPSVYTKVIEMFASQAAGILAAPPQDLGLYTQGNPVSAESAQVSESRRDRRAVRMQKHFGASLVEVAQMALRYTNGGVIPAGYENLAADWQSPQMVNFVGTADGLSKLMAEGTVPRGSDVALRHLGFNAVERAQMKADLDADPNLALITAIGSAVATRAIRAASVLANAANGPQAPPGA